MLSFYRYRHHLFLVPQTSNYQLNKHSVHTIHKMCENFHLCPSRITSHRVMSLFILCVCVYACVVCVCVYMNVSIFSVVTIFSIFNFNSMYPTVVGKTTTLISVHDFSQNLHHIIVVCRQITNCSVDRRENGTYTAKAKKSKENPKKNHRLIFNTMARDFFFGGFGRNVRSSCTHQQELTLHIFHV